MQIGMVGLGRMGTPMVKRLCRGGHECVVLDRDTQRAEELAGDGITAAKSYEELVAKLRAPRVVWVMVPAGEATEAVVGALSGLLESGDTIIDGGNSYFKDDVRRAAELSTKGIHYMDVGTSGGVWGAKRGYCLMIGGERSEFERLKAIFETLAPGTGDIQRTPGRGDCDDTAEKGYLYCGPAGAGHFVKMAHNGAEYGQMKSLGEAFDILQGAASEKLPEEYRYNLDVAAIAEVWRRGSVVVSWLLDLIAMALAEDPSPFPLPPRPHVCR